MNDLLPDYERELAILRRSLGEFARHYPKAAARLSIVGEHSEDPHVERLIQSAALLHARASARIDDPYPELPRAILEIRYPEYLRPFPSCSIAQFDGPGAAAKLTNPIVVARGTLLKTRTGEYPFSTAYDVTFASLRIADVRYASASAAPAKVRLHEGTTGILSVTFAARAPAVSLTRRALPASVRVFVDGDRRTVAATLDTLLSRASRAFVEVDQSGMWIALDAVPIACAGFHDHEALIERTDGGPSPFLPLLEYFAFPEKFDFIDVDLSALLNGIDTCESVTLHLPIANLDRDSATARLLQDVGAANFKLFCTPVINVFPSAAEPISLKEEQTFAYPLIASALKKTGATIYRIDEVRLTQETARGTVATRVSPYHSRSPGTDTSATTYWRAEREGRLAEMMPGHDMLLALVDDRGEPAAIQGTQIDADLLCTNGDLPASLRAGSAQGDLTHANEVMTGAATMLRPPTLSTVRRGGMRLLWDVLAMLSPTALSLTQAGLPAFKACLAAHVPSQGSSAMRHIESMTRLARESVLEWVPMQPQPMLVRGIRVRIVVDETQLADCVVSVFGRVLESMLKRFAPVNSFVELVLVSAASDTTLFEGKPLPGVIALI